MASRGLPWIAAAVLALSLAPLCLGGQPFTCVKRDDTDDCEALGKLISCFKGQPRRPTWPPPPDDSYCDLDWVGCDTNRVRYLYLSKYNLTGVIPSPLKRLGHLGYLYLSNNRFTVSAARRAAPEARLAGPLPRRAGARGG